MAEETVVTNIVANANFSGLISDLNKVTASLSNLQAQVSATNKSLAGQIAVVNRQFGDTLRSTGQFTTHFASAGSDVETFGKNLDKGRLKLREYYRTWQDHHKTAGGLIRDLSQQQVRLQNAIMQPLGRNAEGMMQFAVHVPRGLDVIKNKTALAHQELMIMNRVMQEGANQLINWGKNTQWAGRQLTVGLTVPLAAFGKAAADAFRTADQELVRLTKVYGDIAGASAQDLGRVRKEVTETAKELASGLGASFNETLALGADIAATGKTGEELLGSIRETTRLAILGEVDRQEAMKATLAIQTAFNQNTDQLAESINFLNAVENQTSTTLNDLVEAIPRAGTIIKGLGGSVQDLALYLTAMREGGVSAAEGANALKSALGSLINPTDVAVAKFQSFGIDLLGIVNNNAGNVTQTLFSLQAALDTLDPLQKQQAIEQLFGKFQFARLGALFDNLGRQGSQTLQVLDLMKASSQDLADVAGRELTAVTESASGKYRRALEELKADLASVGEQFLTINTYLLKFVDRIIDFASNLPGPIKSILSFLGGVTAIAGPLIMLTGVLGNFFGYIVKGVYHFKSLFKSAEGWRLLTPEIMAANQAGSVAESTFYSDARAAAILNQALKDLAVQYDSIAARAQSGAISVQPMLSTMAGGVVVPGGGGRVVNPNSPLVGQMGTRASAHMVPRGISQPGTIFGLVPSSMPVNLAVGQNPQMYMEEALPNIPGVTSVQTKKYGQVSTGIVASEAARHHAMTAALAMQSTTEVENLKKMMATTGTVTTEFMSTFDDLVPITSKITQNAATQSAAIVAELRAGKISVDVARQRIIALNIEIERMLGAAATEYAASTGRTINLTNVPTLNQPVMTSTGKSNMRELFKDRTKGFFSNVARALGVRTYGAGYNIETTRPRKMNMGGPVYMSSGAMVPGPNVNADVVPAILTPGEFVVNREATARNLPLLMAINGSGSMGPGYNVGSGGAIRSTEYEDVAEARLSGVTSDEMRSAFPDRFRGNRSSYRVRGTAGVYLNTVTDPAIVARHSHLSTDGRTISIEAMNARMAAGGLHHEVYEAAMAASQSRYAGSSDQLLLTLARNGIITPQEAANISREIDTTFRRDIRRQVGVRDANNRYWAISNRIISRALGTNDRALGFWNAFSREPGYITSESLRSSGEPMRSPSMELRKLTHNGETIDIEPLRGKRGQSFFAHAKTPTPLLQRLIGAGITTMGRRALPFRFSRRNNGGMIPGYNAGGMVSGYRLGGIIPNLRMRGYWPGATSSPLNYQDGQLMPGPVPRGMSMGSNLMLGMAGSIGGGAAGGALGGQTGALIGSMAGYALPSLISKFMVLIKNVNTFKTVMLSAIRVVKMFSIPGLIVTVLAAGIKKLLDWKKAAEDAGKANRLAFGGTADSFAAVGIKNYKTISDRIKDVNEQLELHRAQVRSTYESYTKAGPTGLTLTIKELKDAIENAKQNQKDYVDAFSNIDSSRVIEYATNLKAQFVAMGMAASEATNQIYAIVKASNKSSQAVAAISSQSFKSIQKQTDGIKILVATLRDSLSSRDFNAEEFVTGLDTLLNSLLEYQSGLVGTKDDMGNIVDEADALKIALDQIKSVQGSSAEMTGEQLSQIKQQNVVYQSILGTTESIQSVYAKIALYEQGFGRMLNLAKMTAEQAVAFAQQLSNIQNQMNAITETVGSNNPLSPLAGLIDKTKTAANNAVNSVKSLKKLDEDYYNNKIKLIDKAIDALEEERKKRLELLRIQKDSTDFATTIEQSQARLKNLIASGNFEAAAQEQLNIKKLSQERQYNLAVDAINKKFDEDRAKREKEKEALQNAKDAAAKGMQTAQTTAAQKTADLATLQSYRDRIEQEVLTYQANSPGSQLAKEALMEISNIIEEMKKAGGEVKKAALEIEAKYMPKAPKTAEEARNMSSSGVSTAKNLADAFKSGNAAFSTAVDSFAQAVKDFKGKTDSKPESQNISVSAKQLSDLKTLRGLQNYDTFKSSGAGRGDLTDVMRQQIIQNYGLKKDDTFEFMGVKYRVTGTGLLNMGASRVTKREAFGRVVSGRDYLVGERGPELFRTDIPGNIMPMYNVPQSGYRFNSAGNNGTMGNISLVQTINAAPGMDERALANLAAKQAVSLITAAKQDAMYRNGRNVRVGNA
jgi:TP901 family phage tail tape measure protein